MKSKTFQIFEEYHYASAPSGNYCNTWFIGDIGGLSVHDHVYHQPYFFKMVCKIVSLLEPANNFLISQDAHPLVIVQVICNYHG